MTPAENVALIVLLAALAVFPALLAYRVLGVTLVVALGSRKGKAQLARMLASLSTQDLRQRLLRDPYLSGDLRNDVIVQGLLRRIAEGDEVALAREYPRRKLYAVLAGAERRLGHEGRPEAVDAVSELSGLLQELARRGHSAGAVEP